MNYIKASIGYGYKIEPEDYPKICERTTEEGKNSVKDWIIQLQNNKYFHALNDFNGDGEFFGIVFRSAPFGELSELNEELTDYINYNELPYLNKKYQEMFPHCCAGRKPAFYLMCEGE